MKIAYYIKKESLHEDAEVLSLLGRLGGCASLYELKDSRDLQPSTDILLSFGGDGTFLSAAHRVAEAGIPILGVNLGRLGFLSEYRPDDVAACLTDGSWTVEERDMLRVELEGVDIPSFWPYALNEVSLHRTDPEMIGVDVTIGEDRLPAYWADGVLLATSSGSTAYSLSAGGPICTPDARVRLLTPVAPHNLNLRPLAFPCDRVVTLTGRSRSGRLTLTLDNRSCEIPERCTVRVDGAPFRLKRVRLGRSNFIDALRSRFFWGQDVRNQAE